MVIGITGDSVVSRHHGVSFLEVYQVVTALYPFLLTGAIAPKFSLEGTMMGPILSCVGLIARPNYQDTEEVQVQKPLVIGYMQLIQVTRAAFYQLIVPSHS
jgi:hypothetical protein